MSETDLPQPLADLKQNIEEMLTTAREVKGAPFADGVLFLLNCATVGKISAKAVFAASKDAPDEVLEHLSQGVSLALGAMSSAYLKAIGVPAEQVKELVKFAQNIDNKVGEAEDALSK